MMEYSKYKDSGIPWIGEIPEHWNVLRGKNILTLLERPVQEDDDIITCFRDGEVTLRKNRREEGFTVSMKEIGYQGVETGDLVVHGMDGFAGAIGVSDSRGKATPVLNVMDSKENKRYLMYYLRAAAYKDVFMSLSTGIRVRSCDLRWNKLSVFPFLIPDINEQDSIVTYIDNLVKRVDDIICKAKVSIEEYKSWKASIIYEAVTKGLDSDVEMKDSGVEWIGDIPNSWDVLKLKYVIAFIESGVSVNASQSAAEEGKIGVLKTSSVSKYSFRPEENKEVNLDELGRVSCPVRANTIIVSRMNTPELVGACGYVEQDYPNLFLPDRLWQVHFLNSVVVKYIWYYLSSNYIRNYYSSLSSGTSSSMQNISKGQFENARLLLPPPEVQRDIVEFLDKKCATLDSLVAEKESLIADLEAYKKSLIFEVVTGKRRVV